MPRYVPLMWLSLALSAGCNTPPPPQPGPVPAGPGDNVRPVTDIVTDPSLGSLGTPDPERRMDKEQAPLALKPETDPRLELAPTGGVAGDGGTLLGDKAPLHFVALTGGEFTMGSPPDEVGRYPNSNESPRHRVEVKPFRVSEAEITNLQWATVMGGIPPGAPALPVSSVSWCESLKFANQLSTREGLKAVYTLPPDCEQGGEVRWDRHADGYRLPTEAEWEYAARAGTTTRFWSGDKDSDVYRVDWLQGSAGVHPVKEHEPNPWGLYDVHGNVSEWVFDLYHTYPTPPDGSTTGEGAVARVWRGGNWSATPQRSRSAFRNRREPSMQFDALGFRLVR